MIERRQHKRFHTDTAVYIYSQSPGDDFVGNLIDISRSGIAFSYISAFSVPNDFDRLGILIPDFGSVLEKLVFRTVSDDLMPKEPASSLAMGRRSGLFPALTPAQEGELEELIENIAITALGAHLYIPSD